MTPYGVIGNMELKDYLNSLTTEEQFVFADRCKTSIKHLRNISYGNKRSGEDLCINIERESSGVVRCESLRSDVDWAYLRGTGSNKNNQAA